ncbi:MAG TPA: hypothetical protein VN648_30265, partial [Candidatus Methylomirabilis sp.]|nr:hypothetical protein [Candidatus Methylomirabilis sp.]
MTSGQAIITPDGLPPVTLTTMQAVSITATASGLQTSSIQNLTPAQAREQARDLQVGRPDTGEAGTSQAALANGQLAANVMSGILQSTATQGKPPVPPVALTPTTTPTTSSSAVAPVTPQLTQSDLSSASAGSSGSTGGGGSSGGSSPGGPGGGSGSGGPSTLPTGPLVSLNNGNLTLTDGTSLATFSAGAANSVSLPVPSSEGLQSMPLIVASGNPITHSGTLVAVDPSFIQGATGSTEAPLVKVTGTTLQNTDGPLFDVNNSLIVAFWPVFQLDPGGSATLAGVMNISGCAGQSACGVSVGPQDAITLGAGSSLTSTDALFRVKDGAFLVDSGPGLVAMQPGSTLTLNAPVVDANGGVLFFQNGVMLRETNATIMSAQPLVMLQGGSTLARTSPLVLMNGGSLTVDSILKMQENSTISPNSNTLANMLPLVLMNGGSLTVNSVLNAQGNSTINLGGELLKLDSAVLKASGPIIDMINSSLTTSPPNGPGLMSFLGSNISGVQVVKLDKSVLTVDSGPLLSVTG